MKIKEISALTGLTERTIRFYEERSLIQPRTERRNGREYRDYSASDAEQLMVIAGLRRLHFSVEEIREMQKYPGRIARIAEEARRSRRIDAADQQKAASILERADLSGISQSLRTG
ncbi:MAG TPA: MerR family transcriptional regulator [Candidatus Gallacutalibacter pullicola]|uniref:MerR family transcriptional regulator n=1 Tax=Candidatus Gallacutalibacter pullicola TaxID=2840830 RepID=A0A9D1J1M1_9FIRM|nr:MerR family transcriptional regulator [Candidatus Gallacutalibacter pullicola]